MKIGVLALQGAFIEHAGMLASLGVDAPEVRLPADLEGLDGLVIPGGESTTIIRLLKEYGLYEPLMTMISNGLPVFGTCAGAIVLARSADGLPFPPLGVLDVDIDRNAFGRQIDSFETDLSIAGIAESFHGIFIRAPIIRSVGPEIDVLCHLEDGSPVAVRQGNILASTFHPELTEDSRFHEYFLSMVVASRVAHAS